MDVRQLYKGILEDEQLLKTSLKSKSSTSKEIALIRKRILDKTETLVSLDAGMVSQKELEQVLWKPCFYKRIEDFRRRIRKYASSSSSNPQVKEHFLHLTTQFRKFLDEATGFYQRLNHAFDKCVQNHAIPATIQLQCRSSSHHCLIFLGDLARYRELHNQKSKKDFSKAEGFYHQALAQMPESGNPHNQLAVLATYTEAECIAVYRYCRSLMVAYPFETSSENLTMLLENNRQKVTAQAGKLKKLTQASSHKEKSIKIRNFLSRAIRSHGIFYSYVSPGKKKARYPYDSMKQSELCDALQELLASNAIADSILLRLFVINMFSITQLEEALKENEDDGITAMLRNAVSLFYTFLYLVTEHMTHQKYPMIKESPIYRMLSPISICCDFLQTHQELLQHAHFLVDRDRFLSSFERLLNLQAQPDDIVLEENMEWKKRARRLKESIELRGFLPFASNPIYSSEHSYTTLNDIESFEIRIKKLLSFGSYLCSHLNLMEYHDGAYCLKKQQKLPVSMPSDNMEEDDDDEVIVFQPSFLRSNKPTQEYPALFGMNTLGYSQPAKTDSNSFSMFDNPSQFPSVETSLHNMSNSDVAWNTTTPTTYLPSFLDPPNPEIEDKSLFQSLSDLTAIEQESQRYEMTESSLSGLMSSHSPPPGFTTTAPPGFDSKSNSEVYTTNPFIVGPS